MGSKRGLTITFGLGPFWLPDLESFDSLESGDLSSFPDVDNHHPKASDSAAWRRRQGRLLLDLVCGLPRLNL